MAFALARRATVCAPRVASRRVVRSVVVRAEPEQPSVGENGTVFYAGKSYTPEEWQKEKDSGVLAKPAAAPAASTQSSSATLSFTDVMGFSGSAPEIVNGRLAMLGFVAAIGAEFASGDSVLKQVSEEPTGIVLAFLLFISASLVTAFQKRDDKLGPFTPQAELLNGRAAMIGFASLLIIEAVKGTPLI